MLREHAQLDVIVMKMIIAVVLFSKSIVVMCFYCMEVLLLSILFFVPTTIIIEGSLEVTLPTIWTNGKAEVGRVRDKKNRSEKIREEKE